MVEKYELTMQKSDQILGFSLWLRDWSIPEIAKEINRNPGTIRAWSKKFDWKLRKKRELRDIEQEMRDKVQLAREQIIDIGTQTLDDVFVRNQNNEIVGITIAIEDIKDFKILSEIIMRTGGLPDKVEQKITKELSGELNIKTETISPEMAAEVGRQIALKESVAVEEEK
jgi:hypothetical protein